MILVTGATGKVGSAVVEELQSTGQPFKAMVRSKDKAVALNKSGVETVIADFTNPESCRQALSNIDKVFLLAPPARNMAELEKNFIDACKTTGVKHIVNISAVGTSKDSSLNLGQWHYQTEEYLTQSGIPYTIIRPHSFMQNILANIGSVKAQSTIYSSLADAAVPLVDARDVGAVAVRVLTEDGHAGRIYTITGGAKVTQNDVAAVLGNTIGKGVKYIPVPDEAAHQAMTGMGLPDWLADDLVGMAAMHRAGHGTEIDATGEKILGRPMRTINDFIQDHAFLFS